MVDASRTAGHAAIQVLIVDDEVNVRFAVERRLRKSGHATATASTVRQAIERLRGNAFDVVVCDLRMPGGEGTQLLQWLGSYSPSTSVVVVSAFVTPEFRAEYVPAANLRIVEKPVDLEVLVNTIEQLGPRRGFYGNAIEVELFDYVQMVAISGRDKLIEVTTNVDRGYIWFEHGDVVHAQYGEYRGELAFYKLLAHGRGTFKEVFFRAPQMHTVAHSSTHLLIEAARQADEGVLGQATASERADHEQAHHEGTTTELFDPDETVFDPDETVFDPPWLADEPFEPAASTPNDDTTQATHDFESHDESSFEDILVAAETDEETVIDEDLILPGDETGVPRLLDETGRDSISIEISVGESSASTTGINLFDDPETRALMLGQFWEFENVQGVAIMSSTGKVLAEDMRGNSALVTLAGFYLRGAARIARALGHNVFDGVIAKHRGGEPMLMVSMGATSVVLALDKDCDPERVRDTVLGVSR